VLGHDVVTDYALARKLLGIVPQELVFDWENPDGSPTDLKAGSDGALYVTEDHNGTVLRLIAEK